MTCVFHGVGTRVEQMRNSLTLSERDLTLSLKSEKNNTTDSLRHWALPSWIGLDFAHRLGLCHRLCPSSLELVSKELASLELVS